MGKSRTVFVVASFGVGLAIGGGLVLMHRNFNSRLHLIAERVEFVEDRIGDLKDLINDMIKEQNKLNINVKHNIQDIVQSKNNNLNKSFSNKSLSKNVSEISVGRYDSSLEEDEDFMEALDGYYEGVTNGDEVTINQSPCSYAINHFEGNQDNNKDDDNVIKVINNIHNNKEKTNNSNKKDGGKGINSVNDKGIDADLLNKLDELFEGGDEGRRQAYDLINKYTPQTDNVQYLWRLSKATYYMAKLMLASSSPPLSSPPSSSPPSSSLSPKEMIYEAHRIASEAVGVEDTCADAHKWFAITLGSTNDFEGVNVRIQNGYTFKKHIERAIELKPTDPSNHHLLGRWSYTIYMLSWMERKVSATLFTTPPQTTIQQTLHYFLKAEELNPGKWTENELFIAKCYLEMGEYKTASDWLNKCQLLPCLTNEDRKNQEEVKALKKKYSYYL